MDSDQQNLPVYILNFALTGLSSSETVVIRLAEASDATLAMAIDRPVMSLGTTYGDVAFSISELIVQPHRLFFRIRGAPALLPIALRVRAPGPFLFGSLQVSESVETVVSTAAERIRILGPSYWAIPVPPAPAQPKPAASSVRMLSAPTPKAAPPAKAPAPAPTPASSTDTKAK